MLNDFFKLNNTPIVISAQADFLNSLRTTDSLRDFLYQPNDLQPATGSPHPKIKFLKKTFTNASFSKTLIKDVIFTNCVFKDCLFIGSTIEDCEFHDCRFENVNTHKIEVRNTYLNPDNFKNAITDSKYSNIAVHLFQRIYDNLKDNDQPILAREAEYYFLNWERKYLIQKYKNDKIGFYDFLRKIITRQLHYFIGYGIRFSIFFLSYFTFLLLLGLINYFLWDYYSIKTDLFQCSEIHTPIHVAMFPQSDLGIILAISQSVIGYIFIGVFLSMLIKKIVK